MDDLKDKLTDAATNLGESASSVAEDLQTHAKEAWDSVQHRADRGMRKSAAYVRKNPVPMALAALGLGLILGVFLSRRSPVSVNDRCVARPLHQSRGMLLGLLIACGALLRRTFRSASSAAEDLAGNVGDDLKDSLKPLRRAARQTGRKLGL